MYWIKIGDRHFDLSEAWQVNDRRVLTEEEKKQPERDSLGGVRRRPAVTAYWRCGSQETFHGQEADEFMERFEKFKADQAGPTGRAAKD